LLPPDRVGLRPFHGGNTGSIPAGRASEINNLATLPRRQNPADQKWTRNRRRISVAVARSKSTSSKSDHSNRADRIQATSGERPGAPAPDRLWRIAHGTLNYQMRTLDRIRRPMIESLQQEGAIMADGEKERTARNWALLARMEAPPTKAQVLTELDLEISDAINLAVTADLPTLVRLLRMAKLEVVQIQRRSELKDNPDDC
jgi:hypothetical protein